VQKDKKEEKGGPISVKKAQFKTKKDVSRVKN